MNGWCAAFIFLCNVSAILNWSILLASVRARGMRERIPNGSILFVARERRAAYMTSNLTDLRKASSGIYKMVQ